jgi:hypothetical protein
VSLLDDETPLDNATTRPSYYGGPDAPYEPVKVIDDVGLGPGFYYGGALKYLQRAPHKGSELADLEKAEWYLTNGVALGYLVPWRGKMDQSEIVKAWEVPDALREVVFYLLRGNNKSNVEQAAKLLTGYVAHRRIELEQQEE